MRRWSSLKPELDELGLDFVAISPDTPDELDRFLAGNDLAMTVLSDGNLAVTDRYNLRSFKTGAMTVRRSPIRYLAIPTTILVDADGVVRWIDQATDYRVRSEPARVLPAIREALNQPGS